jgi:hypothetical protein
MSRITSDCGWLSPAGKWHPCREEEHRDLARDLLGQIPGQWRGSTRQHFGDPERALEERGWAKLIPAECHSGMPGFAHWGWDHRPTPRQAKALLEWCLGGGAGRTELPVCLRPDFGPEEGAL